jgi:hypothetical protein
MPITIENMETGTKARRDAVASIRDGDEEEKVLMNITCNRRKRQYLGSAIAARQRHKEAYYNNLI